MAARRSTEKTWENGKGLEERRRTERTEKDRHLRGGPKFGCPMVSPVSKRATPWKSADLPTRSTGRTVGEFEHVDALVDVVGLADRIKGSESSDSARG